MEDSYENVSQESYFMDLTISPKVSVHNVGNEPVTIDRPPRNFGQIGNLRSIQELPIKYRCIFEYPFFNVIQSSVLDDVLYSDVSVVISAPTGSGKTVVFELAIIRLLMEFEEINFSSDYKIVYVAPVKSLCHERLTEWHTKFSKIGLSCIVLTGDTDIIDITLLRNYNIIITTPEKWDSLTRNARESNLLESVKLFMIDEVHLLNDDTRGPNLEVIVSRMKILLKKQSIRFLAVSATIPNIEDIAQWLGNLDQPALYFKIGEELRPVKLNKIVLGYPCASETATFKFDLTLNYKLQNVLMNHAEGKPTLIFCSTRKGVELTSSHLSQNLTFHLSPTQFSLLSSASSTMYSSLHKSFISNGIGCHHAGMSLENRSTVESLFREGHLPVLVATSTLAMGVNLPAHLVVVKGTKQYVDGSFREYSESSLLQMIGRAGRPQFDTSATVVIMTTIREKERYEKMLGGTESIESNLHRHLTEHLNAEVVLGTITDIAIALDWLRYTFLYIRVLKNPKHYNIPTNFTKNQIEKKLQDWCQIEINALNKYGMLQIDQTDGFSVSPTKMGSLMANYYLAFSTMKIFTEIKGNESLSEILMLVSKCNEFSETYLRVNDKKTLNTLNKCKYQETIRFPLKTTIKTTPMKIYCIIQATLGCIKIQNPALVQEAIKIMRIGERITKCLVNYLLHKNSFSALLNALILYQCFTAKMWENSPYVSRQFSKIGPVLSSMLVSAGKTSFKTILETNPRDIERIINRAPPMGNDIVEAVMNLPFYKIQLEPSENDKFKIKITVILLNCENINKKCTAGFNNYMTLLIGDTDNNILFWKKLFHHSMATCKEYVTCIDLIMKRNQQVQVYLISENWVGIDCKENYDIIINQDKISIKTAGFINKNNNVLTNNQKSITSYFKATKNDASLKQPKKTIDTYFSKQNSNTKTSENKLILPSTNISKDNTKLNNSFHKDKNEASANTTDLITNSSLVSNEVNQNLTSYNAPNDFNSYINNLTNYCEDYTPKNNPNYDYCNELNMYNNIQSNDLQNNNYCSTNNTINFNEETFLENLQENITFNGNISINKPDENHEDFTHLYGQENYINTNENNYLNGTNTNNKSPEFNFEFNTENFNYPYVQISQKNVPNFKENKKILLRNILNRKSKLNQQGNFETFSQNLTRKSLQTSQNLSLPSVYSNNCSNSTKLISVEENKSVAKQIQNNIKLRSRLNQFNFTPAKPIHKKSPPNSTKKKITLYSQNKDKTTSQISQPPDNYVKSSQLKRIATNEFKQMNKNKFNKNIPCTITSSTKSNQNNELNILNETQCSDFDPIQICNITYNEEISLNNKNKSEANICKEEINISSSESSQKSENGEEINTENKIENDKKQKTEKPCFQKSFREYVQNSIDKLKKDTLVNEYFNYDIGFQEFLMGPLDANSDEETSDEDDEKHKKDNLEEKNNEDSYQKEYFKVENNFEIEENTVFDEQNNTFLFPEFSFVGNCENIENITISESGEIVNKIGSPKIIENFEHNFKTDQSIFYSSEMNDTNFSFQCSNISTNETNFQVELQNSENSEFSSESQTEFSEKINLKIENRMKIIEQFYNATETEKSPELLPIKRQKLSVPPLLPVTRNKKDFKNPIKKNDTFKNMNPLKQIMSTYGNQYENKVSLSKNTEKELVNDPVINELVKRTSYSYSINQEKESVEMLVTIYEKDQKQTFESNESKKRKLEHDMNKEKRLSLFKPYFRN